MKQNYTPISNILFDTFLPNLTHAELKILLIVLRQTSGWKKNRDRMTSSQLIHKTGLSRRVISQSLDSLIEKRILIATDYEQRVLTEAKHRKGKSYIFFSSPLSTYAENSTNLCKKRHQPVQNSAYNKRNYTKENITKEILHFDMQKLRQFEHINQFLLKK